MIEFCECLDFGLPPLKVAYFLTLRLNSRKLIDAPMPCFLASVSWRRMLRFKLAAGSRSPVAVGIAAALENASAEAIGPV